jgi:hypothetical protein
MTTMRVRYTSGAEDEFEIHEAATPDLQAFVRRGIAYRSGFLSFGVVSEAGGPGDTFGKVYLRMDQVAMVVLDPLTDLRSAAALFADGGGDDEPEPEER